MVFGYLNRFNDENLYWQTESSAMYRFLPYNYTEICCYMTIISKKDILKRNTYMKNTKI